MAELWECKSSQDKKMQGTYTEGSICTSGMIFQILSRSEASDIFYWNQCTTEKNTNVPQELNALSTSQWKERTLKTRSRTRTNSWICWLVLDDMCFLISPFAPYYSSLWWMIDWWCLCGVRDIMSLKNRFSWSDHVAQSVDKLWGPFY